MRSYSGSMPDELSASLAATVRAARLARNLSPAALAERSGVSRAMIAKVEHGAAQPTAALLARLSAALGLTLSELIARAEGDDRRVRRATDQPTWTDPVSGYRRRALSPATGGPLELVEVELPAGVAVSYPADVYAFTHHQIWMRAGRLNFREGEVEHELRPGDCLELGPPVACTYRNPTDRTCRYLVALARR